jgi:hypothetical protein
MMSGKEKHNSSSKLAQRRLRARRQAELDGVDPPDWAKKQKAGKSPDPQKSSIEYKNLYWKDWKQQNKKKLKSKLVARRKAAREYVNSLKNNPCSDCGNIFHPVAMDFDHRPGEIKYGGKSGGVARLVTNAASKEKIDKEIAKCDLVCANCHRIRTAKQRGWDEFYPYDDFDL